MNYELTLESMMEDSIVARDAERLIVFRPDGKHGEDDKEADHGPDPDAPGEINPIPARPHGFTHNPFSDQCNSFPCGRASITIGAPNKISNRCTIFPTKSPIDAAGASLPPEGSANNSELEGAGITASALAQREPSGDTGLHAPSSKLPWGEGVASRDNRRAGFAPNLTGLFPTKFIPSFSFSRMAKIPTAVVADFDTRQSTEGNRYEHPWFTDTWAEHERAH